QRLAVDVAPDRACDTAVDRRKSFEITLGVPGRDTRGRLRSAGQITLPACQCLPRFTVAVEFKVVGIFVRPQDRAFLGIDAQSQVVLFTRRNLADDKHTFATCLETEQG